AADLVDAVVKSPIQLSAQLELLRLVRFAHPIDQLPQFSGLAGLDVPARQSGGHPFDGLPDIAQFDQGASVKLSNKHAAVVVSFDQPLGLEVEQRFADQAQRNLKLLGQPPLYQLGTGLELARSDSVHELLTELMPNDSADSAVRWQGF